MKIAAKLLVLGTVSFLGAGMLLSGCKSAPELTKANAQALIQAKLDQSPAVGESVGVSMKLRKFGETFGEGMSDATTGAEAVAKTAGPDSEMWCFGSMPTRRNLPASPGRSVYALSG